MLRNCHKHDIKQAISVDKFNEIEGQTKGLKRQSHALSFKENRVSLKYNISL